MLLRSHEYDIGRISLVVWRRGQSTIWSVSSILASWNVKRMESLSVPSGRLAPAGFDQSPVCGCPCLDYSCLWRGRGIGFASYVGVVTASSDASGRELTAGRMGLGDKSQPSRNDGSSNGRRQMMRHKLPSFLL